MCKDFVLTVVGVLRLVSRVCYTAVASTVEQCINDIFVNICVAADVMIYNGNGVHTDSLLFSYRSS